MRLHSIQILNFAQIWSTYYQKPYWSGFKVAVSSMNELANFRLPFLKIYKIVCLTPLFMEYLDIAAAKSHEHPQFSVTMPQHCNVTLYR